MRADRFATLVFALTMALGGLIGFAAGHMVASHQLRSAAIDKGAAEWTIDPVTGSRNLEWKTPIDPYGPIKRTEIQNRYQDGK